MIGVLVEFLSFGSDDWFYPHINIQVNPTCFDEHFMPLSVEDVCKLKS